MIEVSERAISGWEAVIGTLAFCGFIYVLYRMWLNFDREYFNRKDGNE